MGMMGMLKSGGTSARRELGNAAIVFRHGANRARTKLFGSTAMTATGAQEAELADARRGIIYFLANTSVHFTPVAYGSMATAILGDFGINVDGFKDLAGSAIENTIGRVPAVAAAFGKVSDKARELRDKLLEPIKNLIRQFTDYIRDRWLAYSEFAGAAMKGLVELFSYISSTLVAQLATSLASAAPALGYVGDAIGIISGVRTGVANARNWYKMNKAGEGIDLLGGHPQQIVKALQRHYATRVAGGVWGTVRSTGTIVLRATADSFGGGAIVGLVTSVLAKIASLIDRVSERVMLGCVLHKARKEWQLRDQSPLISDHDKFCKWFGKWLVACPVLGALILQSGVAANPMRFLQLIGGKATGMCQGANYIDVLKQHAGRYLIQHKGEYDLQFRGRDLLTRNRIIMAYGAAAPAFQAA